MKKVLFIMAFILLFTSAFLRLTLTVTAPTITSTTSHSGPYIKVEPENVTLGPGHAVNQTFSIAIKLYNVTTENVPTGLTGVEINFTWNTALLEPVSFVNKIGQEDGVLDSPLYGRTAGFYDSTGKLIPTAPYTNATTYSVAAARGPGAEEWWGDGTIVEITFKVIYQPQEPDPPANSTLEIKYSELTDNWIPPRLVQHDREHGYCTVLPIPALPLPTIKVLPEVFNASHVGQTFTVNITIEGLVDLWNMSGYTLNLTFDKNALQALSSSEGEFLKNFGNTTFESNINNTAGFVWINGTQLEDGRSAPFGNGTLVTVTFNATTRPPASSKLNITDAVLLRWEAPGEFISLYTISSGYYEMFEILSHTVQWKDKSFTVVTRSNSLVTEDVTFNSENKTLTFNVTGTTGTNGYCEVTIPKDMLKADNASAWKVYVGGTSVNFVILTENITYTTMAFSYTHSTKTVKIVGTWAASEAVSPPDWTFMIIVTIIVAIGILSVALLLMRIRKKSRQGKT